MTGDSSGPPGVGLSLSGAGFGDCDRVYFFLDGGPQLGAAKPDGNGAVRIGGLSIPGQTSPGTHTITASCQRSGANPRSSTTFTVTAAGVHRPGLITAIPQPRDIPTDLRTIAAVAVLALLFVPLVAFPFQLFNSTLEENYNEVRGWFGLRPRSAEEVFAGREIVQLIILVVASGLLYAFLSPDFGLNRTTLITATALSGAVLATGAGFALPTVIIVRERLHEWGKLKVLPGTIATAAMTVGISRLLHFEPGYVYGLIATFMYRRKLSEKTEGRVTALSCLVILALTLAAWFTRVPVSSAAQQPDASVWVIILEVFLGGVFLLGLESLLIDLLPMRFLDGSRVLRWSRAGWAALFGVGLFVLIHVLLVPGSGYVGKTKDYSLLVVIALYVGFALFSLSFWAYFRYRPPREPAAASSTPP